jgi:hypothetical protein
MIAKDGIFSGCVHNCSIVAKGGPILWLCPHCQHYCHNRKGFSDSDHIATLLAKEGILTPAISYPPGKQKQTVPNLQHYNSI